MHSPAPSPTPSSLGARRQKARARASERKPWLRDPLARSKNGCRTGGGAWCFGFAPACETTHSGPASLPSPSSCPCSAEHDGNLGCVTVSATSLDGEGRAHARSKALLRHQTGVSISRHRRARRASRVGMSSQDMVSSSLPRVPYMTRPPRPRPRPRAMSVRWWQSWTAAW